jgi:hypothetical protein
MESNNIFGVLDSNTGKIIPLSELICSECGDQKTRCHNTFEYFPKGRCTVAFYDKVADITFDLEGESLTFEQFHTQLAADVYPQFSGITEPKKLSREMLDIQLDLGVMEKKTNEKYTVV